MRSRIAGLIAVLMLSPSFAAAPPVETGRIAVGAAPVVVELEHAFTSPVVVCTVNTVNNTSPVVVRVDGVNGSSFSVWLQNPGGIDPVAEDIVHYIVMEEGAWDVDGWRMEARRYTSTVTDRKGSWSGQARSYLQAYSAPVVIGQVMSANDAGWSVFWCRGTSQGNPPNSGTLRTGKHVGEDSDQTRADELIGYIVFETGSGELGGVAAAAMQSSASVAGVGNSPPYGVTLGGAFDAAPLVVVGSQNGMSGGDGAWAVLYGEPHATTFDVRFAVDEDQIGDNDRGHVSERIGFVAFENSGAIFTNVSSASGFAVQTGESPGRGSGFSWVDLDGDGFLDAVVTGRDQSRVLMNDGDGTFTASLLHTGVMERQAALLDADDDGWVDVWGVPVWSNHGLMRNVSGALAFEGKAGATQPNNPDGIAAADMDGDGLCDVVIFGGNGNWILFNRTTEEDGIVFEASKDPVYGFNDSGDNGREYVTTADVNNDGWPDFFLHYAGGRLWVSNGDGTWTQNNFGIWLPHASSEIFGSAWGDYDNDGDLDLFVASANGLRASMLWRNGVDWETATGAFVDVASEAGLDFTDAARGCAWGDYDNDGLLDLYVGTDGSGAVNMLFRNMGDGTFERVYSAGAPGDAHDVCFVDYDNDGDLDLAVAQEDAPNSLLRNNTDNDAFLKVRVLGAGEGGTNRAAIGVRVELWSEDGSSFIARRDVGIARGYGGTEPLWLHFGGVDPALTYTVRAHFRTGVREVAVVPGLVSSVVGGTVIPQMITVDESEGAAPRIVRWREVAPIE